MMPGITLRTRLFLSISALITMALLGLVLGLVSVTQMASSQQSALHGSFHDLESGLRMRQALGDQLIVVWAPTPDMPAFERARIDFETAMVKAQAGNTPEQQLRFELINEHYQAFRQRFAEVIQAGIDPRADRTLSGTFNKVRNDLLEAHRAALNRVTANEQAAHDQAVWVSALLGLIGIGVLCVGFVTAHRIARRFGEPIQALVNAADDISRGHYDVALPVSRAPEMNRLSERFATMAEALRTHQATNVNELIAGQQRMQAVLDSIDDGLLMIDRQGLLEHLNPVAQRQLGWDNDRKGRSLGEALDRPDLDAQLQTVLRGGTLERAPDDLSLEVDGETRLLAYSLTPVSHVQGDILGAVMVLHDVTEQRAFERVRSEFVLRASHELRTPVTGMHMAFGLLQERVRFEAHTREADLLKTVNEEMQRLMQLINDLLNFSRYQSGLQKLTLGPCDIEDLLLRAQGRFSEAALAQGTELTLEYSESLPRLHADLAQLDRVLDNLLDNALRHTPTNGHIRLQARRHAERVIISVEDNGEGIAYGHQGRIFEPFVQVGRKKGGAGLGLALCKEIVQLHGGRMGVYSRPGQGTQFYMALPV